MKHFKHFYLLELRKERKTDKIWRESSQKNYSNQENYDKRYSCPRDFRLSEVPTRAPLKTPELNDSMVRRVLFGPSLTEPSLASRCVSLRDRTTRPNWPRRLI